MWFKRVLLGSCAASLALTIVTASLTKDAIVPKRHHTVERLIFPTLQRRQKSFANQTSSSEAPVSVSSTATTSSPFISSDAIQTSTIVRTPTVVITLSSTSLSIPTPTPATTQPASIPAKSGSYNGDVVSTSRLSGTESRTSPILATERPPTIPTPALPSSLRSGTSENAGFSTASDVTSVTKSSIDEPKSSRSLKVSSSAPGPIVESTVTATSKLVSTSDLAGSSVVTSISAPVEGTSQTPTAAVTSPAGDSVTFGSTSEAAPSIVPVQTPQISISETISAIFSTSTLLVSGTASTTAPADRRSTALPSFHNPSTSNSELIASSISAASTSLLQELATTSLTGKAPVYTSVPALSSAGDQVSSSEGTRLSTSELQPTTIAATSSVQISITSIVAPSSLLSLTIEPSSTSTGEVVTSAIETPRPSSLTTISEARTTHSTSIDQLPIVSSSESLSSSSFAEPKPVISDVSSSPAPSVVPLSQSTAVTSSLQSTLSSSREQLTSKSELTRGSSTLDVSGLSSSPVSSAGPALPPGTITQAEPSFFTAPASSSGFLSTQREPMPNESKTATSSLPDVVSTKFVSLISTGSSQVFTPPPTAIESGISVATSQDFVSTGSIGKSLLSSATSKNDVISTFVPSETLVTSTIFPTTSSSTSAGIPQAPSSLESILSDTKPSFSGQLSATFVSQLSTLSVGILSKSQAIPSQSSSFLYPVPTVASFSSISRGSSLLSGMIESGSQTFWSQNPTSVAAPSVNTTAHSSIPTSESSGPQFTVSSSRLSSSATPTLNGILSFGSPGAPIITSTNGTPLPSSVMSNGTQTGPGVIMTSGMITATFSTVYVSSLRSSTLDLDTVAFSLFSSVTGAAVNQSGIQITSEMSKTIPLETSGAHVPASESLRLSTKLGLGANSTWSSSIRPSLTATTGVSGLPKNTTTGTADPGITFTRSALPTGASTDTTPSFNATQAETPQTSSMHDLVNSTTAGLIASSTSDSLSSIRTDIVSSAAASRSNEASTTSGTNADDTKIPAATHTATSKPSQTAAAGSPPPLTTSQTAGVAVGATTGLLIAIVAAVFIVRRFHAAKHGKRLSTGSIYPKVAYLYDPKTGGVGGDAEALMSGTAGRTSPDGHTSRAMQGSLNHMQRHSTGTMPVTRFTSPSNVFRESARDPAIHRYSEYARIDTERALSAAVAGYGGVPRRSSPYAKYPSGVTNPFSDHVIPSPTFAPFSPDDIRRPELKTSQSTTDGRGEYSQMPVNSYAYLNTAASMYPPVSPYERPSTQGPLEAYDTRRHTIDSDPFEHDLLLQVDERNRTSDSVTIFASSPNLMSPQTPRTPVGPKLPVRQPNGMTSARSLLSPVAAKYMHKAQEVKIPRKSIASPILVQVGRSPVIKPFSPPPAAPEHRGWEDIKRHSEKRFSDKQSVPAPLKFVSPVVKKKPVPTSHTRTKPSLTGAGQALLAGNGLPLTVKIPHMYNKSVGLDVPRVHGRPDPAHEDVSSDPVVREKRSRELRFANPALIGKEF